MTQFEQRNQQVETQYNADRITIQQHSPSFTERRQKRDRQGMLARVQRDWIEGFLEPSQQGTAQIALELQNMPSAIITPLWHMRREFGNARPLSSVNASIVEVYDHARGEVLILGEPGAGKTILLLELTRVLLERARQDEAQPIPVVFSLSSWAIKRQSLAEWLVSELNSIYQVPLSVARFWIENDQILPLLDGLDEVAASYRTACVGTINAYRQAHGLVPTVVCCRKTDYFALPTRLQLYTAVDVQPLTTEQVASYLSCGGERLEALRQTLHDDADLRTLASTPLMLNVLTVAYQGKPYQEVKATDSPDKKREHVFALYVQRMLTRHNTTSRYSAEQTIRWLSWLALQMVQRSHTTFLIERIQPDWLSTPQTRWLYRLSTGLLVGLLCLFVALLAGLILGVSPSVGQPKALIVGLIVGSSIGLVGGFIGGVRREITPAERVIWSWKKAWQGFRGTGLVILWLFLMYVFFALEIDSDNPSGDFYGYLFLIILFILLPIIIGLRIKLKPIRMAWSWKGALWGLGSIGLFFSWLVFLFGGPLSSRSSELLVFSLLLTSLVGLISGLRIKLKSTRIGWSWKNAWRGGLVVICLPALLVALLGGPFIGVLIGLSGNTLDKSTFTKPNEGIWRSARNSILFAAIVAFTMYSLLLIVILIIAHFNKPANVEELQYLGKGLLSLLLLVWPLIMITMLISALILGGLACIQHIVLRVFLQRLKSTPWNYPQFLDYAVEHILLHKVGGGYIFLHRLVLEYFANLEIKSDLNVSAQIRQEILSPDTTLSAPAVLIEKGIQMNITTTVTTPPSAEGPYLLPCGHENRPNARFCVVCGISVPL
jgi:hypothetical protein